MWRTLCLLSLMLFTFDFPRDRFARAKSIRASAEPRARDEIQSHREATRGRNERNGLPRRTIYDDDENSSERFGKWRNNGEALEPKWRDGDTVPLFPFSELSRYSDDKADSEEEINYSHRVAKYRRNNGREEPGFRNDNKHVYREWDEKNRDDRPLTGQNPINSKETNNREEETLDFAENKDTMSTRYREAFQIRLNDYEHELDDEEYLKPRPRKRRPPQNYEFALAVNNTSTNERKLESNSGPWLRTQSTSESERRNQFGQNAVELKSLLKMQQEEGLSLSELLQRRNLTLDDLLKGKADAINALKSKDIEAEDYIEEASRMMYNSLMKASTTNKPQWTTVTEATGLKNVLKHDDPMISIMDTVDLLWRKNLTNSSGSSSNATTGKSILATLNPRPVGVTPLANLPVAITTSMPVATNSMQFLQSNGTAKLWNGDEIKPDSLDEDEIMEFSDFTDYKNGRNSMSPVWLMSKDGERNEETLDGLRSNNDGGSTLSIQQILNPTESTKSMKNLSASENNESVYATEMIVQEDRRNVEHNERDYTTFSEQEYQEDAPLMYHDLEQNTQISTPADEEGKIESALDAVSYGDITEVQRMFTNNVDYSLKNHQTANTTEKQSYDDVVSEIEPEARAEIFELFASGSAGKRLERLLKSRNMSLEELIALRQRGSSRVHLAEVSRLKAQKSTSENKPESENNSGVTTVSPPEGRSYQFGERNPTNLPPLSFENATNSDLARPEENTTRRLLPNFDLGINNEDLDSQKRNIEERHRTVQIVDLLTTFDSLPFAKNFQRDFAGEYDDLAKKSSEQSTDLGVVLINDGETIRTNDTANVIQSDYVKGIVKQESNSINIQTVFRETSVLNEDEDNEKGKSLSKVKPSIIASGAILGVTIVVFLAIFIVCRIRQKQKYRYRNTFSRAVFQAPVLAARKLSNSSSLSTVMVNVIATSTTKRPERKDMQEPAGEMNCKSDIDNDSLDANDSWETIPDYMK
ncbi:uncharacterized protein LOC143351716 [Colletes latitarsis]|uniref:uncharacterized protein LOC143351716 n=1 Tax=Colletes latitarsis TaxID=2605962 RepID=UPI004035DEC0